MSQSEFCTLFDVNYLPRGIVLARSLAQVLPGARLRVFCMDEESEALLRLLRLPGVIVIGLAELEAHDRALHAVKPTRDPVEYCWTATPAICLYALEREPELEQITYVDADLMFFGDPTPAFAELGDGSILLVPHRYAPESRGLEELSGIFNVQFMTFRRTDDGLQALQWWHDRCIEWCYRRHEDGKFGDQKYLDDWPTRFAGVRVLADPGYGLAPWNVSQHELAPASGAGVLVDGRPLAFYHHHALRLYRGTAAFGRLGLATHAYRPGPLPARFGWMTDYPLSDVERRLVWEPYIARLSEAYGDVRRLAPGFTAGLAAVDSRTLLYESARGLVPPGVRRRLKRLWRAP